MSDIDDLIARLERNKSTIDDDVHEIVKNNAIDFSTQAKLEARSVMNKGYWTGNLAGQITADESGHLSFTVISNAAYSGFLEYGTRYMNAEPFMYPVYNKIKAQFYEDLKRLVE